MAKQYKDTDTVQTWVTRTKVAAGHDWGRIDTKTIETLNFETRTVSWRKVGRHEGDRVDQRSVYDISPDVTPERAASWRRRNGYSRIG